MKKFTVLIMAALLLTIINGCQKDDPVVSQLTDDEQPQAVVKNPMFDGLNQIAFSVENNRLVFESEEEFQKCINFLANLGDKNFPLFEKEIGFNSYRMVFEKNPEKAKLFPDELYQTLLNPEMEIVVGNYLFKEDPINKKTYAYQFENCYSDLKTATINKYEFNSSDDIFAILKGEVILKYAESDYCGGENKLGYYYWDTSAGQVQYKIVYQSFLYKSLQAKIKKDHSGGAEFISLETDWTETTFYRSSKGCWDYSDSQGGFDSEYNMRPYYSTRKLDAYRFKVYFYCSDFGYTPEVNHNETLKITCKESNGCY